MPITQLFLLAPSVLLAALAAASPVSPEAHDPLHADPALALDDECGAEDPSRCALNAMQLRRSAGLQAAKADDADGDHPFISDCDDAVPSKACPSPLTCVAKPGGSWSQCVDCTSELFFEKDCIMMNAEMREAAMSKCGRACPFTTPRPLAAGCNDSLPESKCTGGLQCVTIADGTWSQCVDCSKRFYDDCQQLKDDMRLAAVKACKRTCLNTQCKAQDWCRKPFHCVGNKTWAQCIQCDTKTFHYACRHWKPSFREIAESKCRRKCQR